MSRARKNLNLRVSEKWIQERREAMALCGCTNLSEWIRTMVEEGETHALARSMSHRTLCRRCSNCKYWLCVYPRELSGTCTASQISGRCCTAGEDTCVEWRQRE